MTIIRREWRCALKIIPFRCEMGAIYVEYERWQLACGRGRDKVMVMMTVSIGVYLSEVTRDFRDMKRSDGEYGIV